MSPGHTGHGPFMADHSLHEGCKMRLHTFCHKRLVPLAGPHHGCLAVQGALTVGWRFTEQWKNTVQGFAEGFSNNPFALGTMPSNPICLAGTWLEPCKLDRLQHLQALPQKVLKACGMTIPGGTIAVLDLHKADGSRTIQRLARVMPTFLTLATRPQRGKAIRTF